MLGKKQSIQEDRVWREAFQKIDEAISEKAVDKKISETVKKIKAQIKGKKVAFAWSGGKDSVVLAHLMELCKVKACMLAVTNLEYESFVEWVENNKPEKLEIINRGFDLEWLAKEIEKRPGMLFPQDSKWAGRWFKIVQHVAQDQYFKDNKLDYLILGRRIADGNKTGEQGLYKTNTGTVRYSPMADWTHEELLGAIRYKDLPMACIYDWHNGFLCGTHAWPARQWTKSVENGWREVYNIEPKIVHNAANLIPSARAFLEGK